MNIQIWLFALILLLAGCNTIRVDVPASDEVSGNIIINSNQAIWKANAVDNYARHYEGEGKIDQTTNPRTDTF